MSEEKQGNPSMEWKEACITIDSLKTLHENGGSIPSEAIALCAQERKLDCIKYLHEIGVEWPEEILNIAACHGDIELIKYVHATHFVNDSKPKWENERITKVGKIAAQNGHLECLQYAWEHFYPPWEKLSFGENHFRSSASIGFRHECADEAAKKGHLHCLQFCAENGCTMDQGIVVKCIKNNQQACLAYCLEKNEKCINDLTFKWLNKFNADLNIDAYPIFRTLFNRLDTEIKEDTLPNLYKQLCSKRDMVEQQKQYVLTQDKLETDITQHVLLQFF